MFVPPDHITLLDAVDAVASDYDRDGIDEDRAEREASQRRSMHLSLNPPAFASVMNPHDSFFALQAMVANSVAIATRAEQAREEARKKLCQALGMKIFLAKGIDTGGNIHTIPAEPWRTEAGVAALKSGVLDVFPPPDSIPQRLTVFLPIAALEKLRSVPREQSNSIAAEKRLTDALEAIMRANPGTPRSKKELRADPDVRQFNVSGKAFERAWGTAIDKAGAAAWRQAGRRRTMTSS